ncbi:MAG: PorV/PorQ family protein [bacterium]|nr:PorV/PorQ family protein [bacterium]
MKGTRFLTGGVILLLALTLSASAGWAGSYEKAGTASAPFLKTSSGARAAGMGGAYCGIPTDLDTVYLNPAGLAGLNHREFGGAMHERFEGVKQGSLALALPWNQRALGFGVIYSNSGDIDGYGNDPDASDFEQGTFDATDYALAASLAGGMISDLSYGISVKMINSKIKDDAASLVFALDVGGLYQTNIPGLSVGFSLQNLGNKVEFHEEKDDLPLSFRIGGAYNQGVLTVVSDVGKVKDSAVSLRLGGEYCFKGIIAVRGGYHLENGRDDTGLTFGLGVNLAEDTYQFDYAYIPYDDLDDIHHFSAKIRF